MDIEQLLRDEIRIELDNLTEMDLGGESYKTTVEGITKLMGQVIEIEKTNMENEEKAKAREFEERFKLRQMDEDRKDRLIKNCIASAGVIIPAMITIWGTLKSFEFEKEGTVTTIMGRGFINKLLPKK